MLLYVAIGIDSTRSRARVLTPLSYASQVVFTMSLNGTLWPATCRWCRISNHSCDTSADGLLVGIDLAVGVSSTRWWGARICGWWWRQATLERVPGISSLALAIFTNLCYDTVSINSARAGLAENRADRFLSRFAAVFFGFSGKKTGLALACYGSIRLFDAFSVGPAWVGFAAGKFNCETWNYI